MLIPACDTKLLPIRKLRWFEALFPKAKEPVEDTASELVMEEVKTDLGALECFRARLIDYRKTGRGNIRIAYYGDSIIEGDLITGMLRKLFQDEYGGVGVGMMPITSIVAGFRPTIKHSFSKNWESVSFMSKGKADVALGITGFTFIPRPYYIIEKAMEQKVDTLAVIDSLRVESPKSVKRIALNSPPWVKYQAQSALGGAGHFGRIRMFYSHAGDSSFVMCSLDNQAPQKLRLRPGNTPQVLELNSSGNIKTLYLEFSPTDPIHVYGVSFDEDKGAYVDSYTIRGYSGMYFERIDAEHLKGYQRALDYDLLILHYGENVSHPKIKDYGFYYRGMTRTLAHIKSALPDVPVLLISAHGRSIKEEGKYVVSPDIPLLVGKQAEIAKDNGCAYINIYEAMGGSSAMADYVAKGMAQKDYTHFTRKGAEHLGQMIYKMIKGQK